MSEKEDAQVLEVDRRTDLVLRLLKGDDIQALSEESGQSVATLSRWREEFLSAGRQRLGERAGGRRALLLRVVKGIVWWTGVVAVVLIGGCVVVGSIALLVG